MYACCCFIELHAYSNTEIGTVRVHFSALMKVWYTKRLNREARIAAGARFADGKVVSLGRLREFLGCVVHSGERVCVEGDNQKQADVLARALANLDPLQVH